MEGVRGAWRGPGGGQRGPEGRITQLYGAVALLHLHVHCRAIGLARWTHSYANSCHSQEDRPDPVPVPAPSPSQPSLCDNHSYKFIIFLFAYLFFILLFESVKIDLESITFDWFEFRVHHMMIVLTFESRDVIFVVGNFYTEIQITHGQYSE